MTACGENVGSTSSWMALGDPWIPLALHFPNAPHSIFCHAGALPPALVGLDAPRWRRNLLHDLVRLGPNSASPHGPPQHRGAPARPHHPVPATRRSVAPSTTTCITTDQETFRGTNYKTFRACVLIGAGIYRNSGKYPQLSKVPSMSAASWSTCCTSAAGGLFAGQFER